MRLAVSSYKTDEMHHGQVHLLYIIRLLSSSCHESTPTTTFQRRQTRFPHSVKVSDQPVGLALAVDKLFVHVIVLVRHDFSEVQSLL